jgi:phosphatidylserine/phosphatidylglycerophosphate/cardiolipin synthase-like enzyme
VSAFINDDVVNTDFISSLRAAIRRGAKIYLGIGDDNMAQSDAWKRAARERALASLDQLQKEHPEHLIIAQKHHHAKILVCDSQFVMTGSYNFLSFRGDHRKVRDEQAVLMRDPADIDEFVKDVMKRFFSPAS